MLVVVEVGGGVPCETLPVAAAAGDSSSRSGGGYDWMIGHSIEAVEPAEMQRRYDAMASGGKGG